MHCDIQPFAEYAVTPFVGVWIETYNNSEETGVIGVTPFVGVWIETTRRCGSTKMATSHPSWVCGLKRNILASLENARTVTPFVGVWIETDYFRNIKYKYRVTPFVGVWIETCLEHRE